MTDLEKAQSQISALKRLVLQEQVRRLSAERQAAQASMAVLQMRLPMIEQEVSLAQHKLAELTKEEDRGPTND